MTDRRALPRPRGGSLGLFVALGACIGAGMGVALGNVASGIGIGVALGIALGLAVRGNGSKGCGDTDPPRE
ncbi:hypothetical protein J7I44_10105 [Frateuria sp. MAH-13]|uniref:Glycine zipper-like domain-containing protein n=1 Tax=Frateuria flava TaxID=2821489 RepID=A0ABS4DNM9_9GAMM|nr:hypothetical protein [Frateuria flava]MBP1474654.1 hypothetical protein [Frateuria flava]